ncbi:MAG: aldehyde dehydrogenase family protein, partial [Angustibacter sp.]
MAELSAGHQWIDGRRRSALAGAAAAQHDVVDPSTGEPVETAALASTADVDAAVAAAVSAQAEWGRATPAERSTAMHRLAAERDGGAEELAQTETAPTGPP